MKLQHPFLLAYGLCQRSGSTNIYIFLGRRIATSSATSKTSSTLSTSYMESLVQKLLGQQNRKSTVKTYLNVWRQFNKFVLSLDKMPDSWEARATLFIAYLIDQGKQSASIKSYVSAIKKLLVSDGYKWKDEEVLLNSLTKACRMINDRVRTRLPIHCGLFELERYFAKQSQFYLEWLYKAIFLISYYGLMRVGEVTSSPHVLKAKDVHLATNKDKLMVVLYTSKTHGLRHRPQKIKITSNRSEKSGNYVHRHFCPFKVLRKYLSLRGNYTNDCEPLFIFRDGQAVRPQQANLILKSMITNTGLDSTLYSMHSFRIGRTSDLIKFGYTIEEVQRMGRWRSTAVYKYIRS